MLTPTDLATLTAAGTLLATECMKGLASEAGKSTWSAIRSLMGWTGGAGGEPSSSSAAPTAEPDLADLPARLHAAMAADDELARAVAAALQRMDDRAAAGAGTGRPGAGAGEPAEPAAAMARTISAGSIALGSISARNVAVIETNHGGVHFG